MNGWPWRLWLIILLPVLALFGPVLFTDRSFAMRDAAHFYHPLFEWTTREWARGRVPLWNPQENCGMPVLADASSSVFYPGKLVFALPLDFTLRYKLYIIGHVVLAAAGSYRLARHWNASQFAAAAAALSYSCGGNVVFQYCNVVFLVGAAWLPFAALAADKMLVERSWRGALWMGIVLALMILGGEPQAAYHGLLITGMYAVLLSLGKKQDEKAAVLPGWKGIAASPFLQRILLLGLAALAGFLLAAVQILPSAEASQESERAAYRRPRSIYEAATFGGSAGETAQGIFGQPDPTTHHERAYYFSIPPWRLAEFVWPNIGGRMFPTQRRWLSLLPAEGRIWTPTLYLGLLPFLLAVAQWALRRGDEHARWLSWVVLLFTLGSFGWYGLGWIARELCVVVLRMDGDKFPIGSQVGGIYWLMTTLLPAYVNFRYPAKLLIVVALALSQLAAIGWDRLFAERREQLPKVLRWLGWVSAGLLVSAWALSIWLHQVLALGREDSPVRTRLTAFLDRHRDNSLGPFDWQGSIIDVELSLLQTVVLCAALLWLLGRAWEQPEQKSKWQLAALLVVALDLAAANYWLVPTAPASIWRNPPLAAQTIADQAKPGEQPRVFRANLMGWRPDIFRQHASRQRLSELAAWERDTLFPKYGLNHGMSLVESYGSIKSVHYESLLLVGRTYGPPQPGESGRSLPSATLLRLMGTQYLTLPDSYVPAAKDKPLFATRIDPEEPPAAGAALWRMNSPLPRAWIVHQVVVLPPLSAVLDLDAIDSRATDVLFPLKPGTSKRAPRDFRTTAVLETNDSISLAPAAGNALANLPAEDSCRIVHEEPTEVRIEAALTAPGVLVLSDQFAPGWIAQLQSADGAKAVHPELPIYRTNRVFRGVIVPAGKHTVIYTYRPASFYGGAGISTFSWLAFGLIAIFGVLRRRGRHLKSQIS